MSGITLNVKHSEQTLLEIETVYRNFTSPVCKEGYYGVGWLTVKTKVIDMGQHGTQERTLVRVRPLESLLSLAQPPAICNLK